MPRSVADVDAVCLFKARLDKFWMYQEVKYDFAADLSLLKSATDHHHHDQYTK